MDYIKTDINIQKQYQISLHTFKFQKIFILIFYATIKPNSSYNNGKKKN